jgi:hypothetical protein
VLASGQQVIIEGPHAKGAMHYWRSGDLITHREWLKTYLVTGDHVFTTMRRLREWVDATPGLEKIKLALPTGSDRAAAVSIKDPTSPHATGNHPLLARCVQAIDLNDDRLADYDTWCVLLRAVCAACNGDMPFFTETVLPWLQTNTSNVENEGDARMEATWESFRDSQVGAEFVYQWAAQFGCNDGIDAINQQRAEQAQELFAGTPDVTGADGADGQGADGLDAAGLPGAGNPGGGPLPLPDTHNALAAEFEAANQARWRFDTREKKWYVHEEIRWTMDDRIVADIRALTAARSRLTLATVNGPQGAARSRALESNGTIRQVKSLMEGSKTLTVNHEAWDRTYTCSTRLVALSIFAQAGSYHIIRAC